MKIRACMAVASVSSPGGLSAVWLIALAVAAAGGFLIGGATSIGQGTLAFELSPMANSAGSWCFAAFALAAVNRRPRLGVVLGAVALFSMVLGYAFVSDVRGYATGSRLVPFWGLASIVVGPALGVGAAWFRGRDPSRIAAAAAALGGILIGEAVYGLTIVATTTPVVYWSAQMLIGLCFVTWVTMSHLTTSRSRVLCIGLSLAVAIAVWLAYVANPLSLL